MKFRCQRSVSHVMYFNYFKIVRQGVFAKNIFLFVADTHLNQDHSMILSVLIVVIAVVVLSEKENLERKLVFTKILSFDEDFTLH